MKHWITTVFNENIVVTLYLLCKYDRTQLIYSTEHVFENFGGELPGCGISCRTCQHHLEPRAANVWDLVQSNQ